MSHSVPTSQHDDHVGRVNRQRTTSRVRTWSLSLVQNVMNEGSSWLLFQVAHVRSRLYVGLLLAAQEDEQPSYVLERGASCRSVHERVPFFQGSTERAREKGALACVPRMDRHSI